MAERPRVLIEEWLPIDTVGCESMRERGASSALPPLYFLHVWWARRPLLTSRAGMLASVLPAWSDDWPKGLRERFPTEESYREWFVELCGIFGDPVEGRKKIQWAKDRGIRLSSSPYDHDRAFKVSPSEEYLGTLGDLLEHAWGERRLSLLDPFAGGGSIPFEGLRYGFQTIANELNPVACVILKATLQYPFEFGPSLAKDIKKYGRILTDRVGERLEPFYPPDPDGSIYAYLWARTVACPYTGKPIPLSPNWWLSKRGKSRIAVRPIFDPDAEEARFEVVRDKEAVKELDPNEGTVYYGKGISPWAQNQPVDGDHIKAEAQAGRMGDQLYCVAIKKSRGFDFRSPTEAESDAVARAEEELARKLPEWDRKGWVPNEKRFIGPADRSANYGILTWDQAFSPRQLLSLCTYVEAFHELRPEIEADLPEERAKAVVTYLGLALDKALDYNSKLASWDSTRHKVRNTFDRHDFSFKWSFAEFDASRNLFTWVLDQVRDAYQGLADLAEPAHDMFEKAHQPVPVRIAKASATDLSELPDASIDLVLPDPPYYDNVMYAELSDFFYVWMKRTLGKVHPEFFDEVLTNKDDEAVANPARFESLGRKKKHLALKDYERKMAAFFKEARRVLKDDGVLTVMFTHKQVEAWDTLATSLMEAGFVIRSSWPVHTESQHSLHQAKKNAARSTILLTCRKREAPTEPVWWDDLKGQVRRTARETAKELEDLGISGVDLYISTFGPTLAILSEHWPVLTAEVDEKTGDPKPLRPDVALDLAREEVVGLRKQGLLLGREVQFDPCTDWYLMAWDAFQAQRFPADEARKLAIALGLDLESDVISGKRLVTKKGSDVILLLPARRRGDGRVDPDGDGFDIWIDAVHTAMLLYKEDGPAAARAFLQRLDYLEDATFKALLQALINAVPRTRRKGKFVRPEAEVLESLRLAFFDELEAPVDDAEEDEVVQGELLDDA